MPFTIMVSKFAIIKKKTNFIIIGLFDHHFGEISKMPLQINLCKDFFLVMDIHICLNLYCFFIGRQTIFLDPPESLKSNNITCHPLDQSLFV